MSRIFSSSTQHTLSIILLCFALGISSPITHAQTEETVATQTPAETSVPETPVTPPAAVETRASQSIGLTDRTQDRIINLIENIKNRLTAVTNRMDNIITRLESRIGKIRATGIDTTPVEAELEYAKASLLIAKETLTNLPPSPRAIRSGTPRDGFLLYKEGLMQTRNALRDTHEHIKKAIVVLKEVLRGGVVPLPETTATNTASTTTP